MHAVEYFIFGFLLARLMANSELGAQCSMFSIFLLAFLIAFAYGGTDELHQYFVPGRQCSLWDLLADGLGAGLGVYGYILRFAGALRAERL